MKPNLAPQLAKNSPETRSSSTRTRSLPRGTQPRLRPRLGRPRVVPGERAVRTGGDARTRAWQRTGSPPRTGATAQIRPTQQRTGAPSGAPGPLLCQEAAVSLCAPGRRPSRASGDPTAGACDRRGRPGRDFARALTPSARANASGRLSPTRSAPRGAAAGAVQRWRQQSWFAAADRARSAGSDRCWTTSPPNRSARHRWGS
jgi:hypothetical protein